MSISSQNPFVIHTANGATTTFTYPFKAFLTGDIDVYLNGVIQSSGYSVVLRDTDGDVVFSSAPANGVEVAILRDVGAARNEVYTERGPFLGATVNRDLDRRQALMQEVLARSIQQSPIEAARSGGALKLPPYDYGSFLGWGVGNKLENISPSVYASGVGREINSIADLRLITGNPADTYRTTKGYYTSGDGGGNSFYWDGTSALTDNGGTIIKPTLISGAGRWLAVDNKRVSLAQFGAIAGIDSTAAIVSCFAHANSLIRSGLVSTIKNAGCTVVIEPVVYSLDSISTAINILCNVENLGGDFVVPLAYADTVLVAGHTTSGTNLAEAHIELPVVRKPTSNNPLVAGSLGVQLRNINASRIYMSRINYFETLLKCGGIGEGTVYNDIFLGQLAYGKVLISLSPSSAGWCNSNRFFGGNLSQSSGFAGGTRLSGYKHLLVDGRSPATSVVGNSFYGTSFEGDVSEFTFDFNFAYKNTFYGCYHETGRAAAAVTVSGDTITRVAHGFAVGDKLTFQASAAPTGMFLTAGYYVVSVPTSDTFKVSLNKGGSSVTFASTGTSVTCLLASVFRFNQTGAEICADNKLVNLFLTSASDINVLQTGQAINNGIDPQNGDIKAAYSEQDAPIFRGQNTASVAANKPIFAAYSNSNNPDTSVNLWGAALSSSGVLYQSAGTYIGALKNNGLSMTYQRSGEAAFDIASCTRSPTLLAVTALSCTAGAQTTATLTLTGAAVSDHLTFTPSSLPTGIIIASAIITSANTITVSFYNYTGSAISLTANFQAMATRRYY